MSKMGEYFVMLVDDNEIDCFINSKMLDKAELANRKLVINSPLEALDYLRKENNNPDNIPDIILLDIYMPQMTGFEFLHELDKFSSEEVKEKCSIYLLSSTLDPRDLSKAAESKYVNQVISKPLSLDTLLKIKEQNGRVNF